MVAMIKKVISKVGKRHRPEIDMMEFMQIEEIKEFDLDKHSRKPLPVKKSIVEYAEIENEQIAEFSEEIENQE